MEGEGNYFPCGRSACRRKRLPFSSLSPLPAQNKTQAQHQMCQLIPAGSASVRFKCVCVRVRKVKADGRPERKTLAHTFFSFSSSANFSTFPKLQLQETAIICRANTPIPAGLSFSLFSIPLVDTNKYQVIPSSNSSHC